MSMSSRRVVAILSDAFAEYQRTIVHHAGARLRAAGYGTVCIASRDVNELDVMFDRAQRRVAHPIANSLDVAGSIILSPVVGRGFSDEELSAFLQRLSDRPVVSFGQVLPNIPSVSLSSAAALDELMAHMTRDCARQRFAFVRGFAGDPDSDKREEAFRRGLAARGLEIDERLIIDGHYISADSFIAVDTLLREGQRFDALVAANDDMAASAVTALERHGLSVPNDVIVSGFDDRSIAIELHTPLTTINQQVAPLSIAAAELLLDDLERVGTPEADLRGDVGIAGRVVSIDAQLVVRASSDGEWSTSSVSSRLATIAASTAPERLLDDWLGERVRHVHAPVGTSSDAIVSAFWASCIDGSDRLMCEIESQLRHRQIDVNSAHWWQNMQTELEQVSRALPFEGSHAKSGEQVGKAVALLGNTLRASRGTMQFEGYAHRQLHEQLIMRLAASTSHEAIWTLLRENLTALGLSRTWVALIVDDGYGPRPGDLTSPERADIGCTNVRLAFSLDDELLPDVGSVFQLREILPDALAGALDSDWLVLCPLRAGDAELGYLLVDTGGRSTLELSAITTSLALAIRQVNQVVDLKHRAEELRVANTALSNVARYDSLTGLPNRVLFHENLDDAFERAVTSKTEIALLFIDLDGFKLINDTLGHSAGDHLLRIVASRVGGILRRGDSLARLGGDELTIIAMQTPGDNAAVRIADDVLSVISRPCCLGERVVNVSASIGIAYYPADGVDAETLIRNADTAMYHAKGAGKSRHALYTNDMNREAIEELEIRDDLRRGLEREEFHMVYQPRVDLSTGRITSFEALLRWRDGVGPARFIPVAEQCGLIAAIDTFSLDAACRQVSVWCDAGFAAGVSVNLSVKRLQEDDIVAQIVEMLHKHDTPAELIELEVTESAAMSDIEGNIVKLDALRSLGLRIAIDDFGTGYSSLNYLRRLPVTSLKVDRSFLSGINSTNSADTPDAAIVKAVVALSSSLGFRVVAEGVENDAQLRFLKSLGCDEGQGYLFARPIDVAGATDLLVRERSGNVVPLVTAKARS